MEIYRKKTYCVNAEQWFPPNPNSKKSLEEDSLGVLYGGEDSVSKLGILRTAGGDRIIVRPGNWIVECCGKKQVFKQKDFEELYEIVYEKNIGNGKCTECDHYRQWIPADNIDKVGIDIQRCCNTCKTHVLANQRNKFFSSIMRKHNVPEELHIDFVKLINLGEMSVEFKTIIDGNDKYKEAIEELLEEDAGNFKEKWIGVNKYDDLRKRR